MSQTKTTICLKDETLHVVDKMSHIHYEEQYPERFFFMIEAPRDTRCLLATGLKKTNSVIVYFM